MASSYKYAVRLRGKVVAYTTTKREAEQEARAVGGTYGPIGKNPSDDEGDVLEGILVSYYVEDANKSYTSLIEALTAAFAAAGSTKMASISLFLGDDPFDEVLGGVDFIFETNPNFPLSQPGWGGYYVGKPYGYGPFIRDYAGALAKIAVLALQEGSASMKHGPTSYDPLGRGVVTGLTISRVSMWAEEDREFSLFTERSLKQHLIRELGKVHAKTFTNQSI